MYDKSGYHIFLPAIIIHQDIGRLNFYSDINNRYFPGGYMNWDWYGIVDMPTGKRLNKYPCGVSIMDLPFFMLAHLYNTVLGKHSADGYSLPYQFATFFGTIFWVCLGLFALRKLLLQHYSDTAVLVALISVALGTNLYFYTTFDAGMSHPYSFGLIAIATYYTDKWYSKYRSIDLIILAALFGMITILRPTNVMFAIIILLWKVDSINKLSERFRLYTKEYKLVLSALIVYAIILFIQLSYWKYVTGHWVFYSYGSYEKFLFDDPAIFRGLFGFRKGWFIYTPIAFIAMLGFVTLWRRDRAMTLLLLSFLSIYIYVTFSWYCWWYGGGFGARPLIDILSLAAIPLTSLVAVILSKNLIVKTVCSTLLILLLALNMFQSYQFSKNILSYDYMTAKYYWSVFLKQNVTEEDMKYLMTGEERLDDYYRSSK
jgi:hypothetical protein